MGGRAEEPTSGRSGGFKKSGRVVRPGEEWLHKCLHVLYCQVMRGGGGITPRERVEGGAVNRPPPRWPARVCNPVCHFLKLPLYRRRLKETGTKLGATFQLQRQYTSPL